MIDNEYLLDDRRYLFRQMAETLRAFVRENPDADLLNMGVGDVVMPVAPVVAYAIRQASYDLQSQLSFRGYPPTEGYDFAREAVRRYYADMGAAVRTEDICIGAGAKDELSVWNRVIDADIPALIVAPAYPVYVDNARLVGRRVRFVRASADDYPVPDGVDRRPYLIYLCSPNNPTGQTYPTDVLRRWVQYARESNSIILFDAAYAAFAYPYTITSIEGAAETCVEIGTLSKCASFSGLRFGWSIIGEKLLGGTARKAYLKYKSTATNGVSYVVQRAAESALSGEGVRYAKGLIGGYKYSAKIIAEALQREGYDCRTGAYLWLKLPEKTENPFEYFLQKSRVVVTDGAGFGEGGDGYVRLSVFSVGGREEAAAARLLTALRGIQPR